MSLVSFGSAIVESPTKWNAAGSSTAMTEMVSNDELSCVTPIDSQAVPRA